MPNAGAVFSRPRTPAAKCLHLVRLNHIVTRSELVEATGLSQPTITRTVSALIDAGLIQQRTDLTRSQGRGRPTIPLELAPNPRLHAGIAVGTSTTYIGLFDTRGRTIRDVEVPTPVARLSESDFIEHVMAGLNRLRAGLDRPLVCVGVTTSGRVSPDGVVNAQNLGWQGADVAGRLSYQFSVPVVVSGAVPAILGSEIQSTDLPTGTMALFADDSLGAAIINDEGISQIDLPESCEELTTEGVLCGRFPSLADAARAPEMRAALDQRARCLGDLTAKLARDHGSSTVVVAGSAFIDDPAAPKLFASQVRSLLADIDVELRLIPTHQEIVRAIARAVALDQLLREPLNLYP
ncbi:ROK family transcriptional regulator [Corynebacterium alimapuense]|uniref:Crp/Fnr family transcriptional regulator n=1 Tax=Corynebacterium alimapuense TaxID=1576874 RepID=A0A3M8K6P9_9CORY|nr:ROK family transcriptional regulator [Corynebacterium alimapuense]RNE48188.1 Crp/Fnr family transcriptional regulator [Corynebacterium alimapuense]